MTDRLTPLDGKEAMEQAWMTADRYLAAAIECIDLRFGKGYARANPELLGAFIQAAAQDYDSWARLKAAGAISAAIEEITPWQENAAPGCSPFAPDPSSRPPDTRAAAIQPGGPPKSESATQPDTLHVTPKDPTCP